MKSYIKDYPRPQLVRSESNGTPAWASLNGSWDFAFDDSNSGEKEHWFGQFPKQTEIQVPFTYETKLSGIGDETPHENVWYQKVITIPAEALGQNRLLIHFEGCDYRAKIWVNGTFVGEHTGGYSRFAFDVSQFVQEGENTLTVKSEDSFCQEQPRGKQRWIPENFACWYVQTTGIWKTVWVEFVPKSSISALKLTPCLESKTLEMEFDVISNEYGSNLMLEAEVSFNGIFVNKVCIPILRKHICTSVAVSSIDVFEWVLKTWSPEHPDLYDLTLIITKDGKVLDKTASYFGMRDIRIENGNILLNGVPIYQRLILDQGYWKNSHLTPPSEEALIEDIDKIIALGYNGLRKHQKTEDERFLYWCDVKGLFVWSEMAAAYTFTDYAVEEFTRQWMEVVKQNYSHPSIITWTPFNESWGISDVETNKSQQNFTEAIYHLTKAFDKNRPVIVNDGWVHTVSDIITLHDYQEVGEIFKDRYTNNKDKILTTEVYHNGGQSAFANGYSYRGQPIIISEYGGIAISTGESGWGYGDKVESEEDFLRRFDDITTAIKEVPYICGYCYTQVSDVQQEVNGLMDIERNFKIDPKKIKKINEKSAGLWQQACK